ncbi:alpha/beta hydrolase [Roseomonas sp. SSH11]|uniref:Alpha/beta hydrolase n=1 Tax=Pararoseomonas baculiformis TaxID=2820812 RepID=A0ABS4AFZ2_9PROT|nr:alpha/beta hydrolase [Pararoseomonas baculiformis]MBP0445774.1 alpha/beta hydrolase [Pararoseomonas baculiformis]
MTSVSRRGALLLPLGLAAFASACAPQDPTMMMPADPSGRADPEQRALLETLQRLNPRPIEALSAAEARRQPSYADAVKVRARELANTNPGRVIGSFEDITISTLPAPLRARLYRPIVAHSRPLPLIVYFHGGGWVIADIETYDFSARALSRLSEALVLSVHYRQGPEFRFPTAHDDANAAYAWAVRNAASLGADPGRIAVAGESAGGNLALNTAILARDTRLPLPRAVAAIYPVAGVDLNTPSYQQFANAKPLNRPAIEWFVRNYTRGPQDLQDPRLDLVGKADLAGLPPVVLVNAEIDPLASDGQRLAEKLRAAGVPVAHRLYPGVTHEFFGADAVLTRAREAQEFVGAEMQRIFAAPAAATAPAPAGRRPMRRPAM